MSDNDESEEGDDKGDEGDDEGDDKPVTRKRKCEDQLSDTKIEEGDVISEGETDDDSDAEDDSDCILEPYTGFVEPLRPVYACGKRFSMTLASERATQEDKKLLLGFVAQHSGLPYQLQYWEALEHEATAKLSPFLTQHLANVVAQYIFDAFHDAHQMLVPLIPTLAPFVPPQHKSQVLSVPGMISRFGGDPQLAQGEVWPSCLTCNVPLNFVFQILISELPPVFSYLAEIDPDTSLPRTNTLIQVFACPNDWDEDSHGNCDYSIARMLDFSGTVKVQSPVVKTKAASETKDDLSTWKICSSYDISGWICLNDFPESSYPYRNNWRIYGIPTKVFNQEWWENEEDTLPDTLAILQEEYQFEVPKECKDIMHFGGFHHPNEDDRFTKKNCAQCKLPMHSIFSAKSLDDYAMTYVLYQCPRHKRHLIFVFCS